MRYIFWQQHKTLIRNLIFLMMGVYLGIFICLYFHGEQLDQLIDKNEQLSIKLKSCNNENAALLQEKKQRMQNQLIRTIKFHINEKLEPFIETELLKVLMDETNFLIGKKVDDVGKSPEFIYQLLNEKSFIIKEKKMVIIVRVVYVQSITEIWLSVKEQN